MTTPDPRMRASDGDRQRVVDRLADHFTAGRLTAAEYDERVQRAYACTYLDELPALTADLPEERPRTGGWGGGTDRGGERASWSRDPGPRSADGDSDEPGDWSGPGWSGRRTGPGWGGPGWGRPGWGRPGWGRFGGRRRPPVAILPVVAIVILLLAVTHGFFLIPLLWVGLAVLIIGRRRGHCGHRSGPRPSR